jgi:hypothetical protein
MRPFAHPSLWFVTYSSFLVVGEQNICAVYEAEYSSPPLHMLKHNEHII